MSVKSGLSDQDAPKIEFPCLYPIKIIGKAVGDFQESVLEAIERELPPNIFDIVFVQYTTMFIGLKGW